MAEELQHLLDKIQSEGVDKARQEADQIISDAKKKAAEIVKESEEKASANLKKAEQDAAAYTERSTRTLEQASRDILITVGQGVENIIADLVADKVDQALDDELLKTLISSMVENYAKGGTAQVLLNEKDEQQLVDFFKKEYEAKMEGGVELHADNDILNGFRVSLKGESVSHDFTGEAIAEAMTSFLRPQLAEIVHRVAKEGASS